MAKPLGLTARGRSQQVRIVVPKDLQEAYGGRRDFRITLKSSGAEAKAEAHRLRVQKDAEFAERRKVLASATAEVTAVTADLGKVIALGVYAQAMAQDDVAREDLGVQRALHEVAALVGEGDDLPQHQRQDAVTWLNALHGDEITRAKDRLEALHAASASTAELSAVAGDLLRMTPMPFIVIGAGQLSLYRARPFEPDDVCTTTRQMHYPPQCKAKMGRANADGKQVFYSSIGASNAVKEAKVTVGQQFVLAEYAIRANLGLLHVGLFNSTERDWLSRMAKNTTALHGLDEFGRQNVHEAHRWLGDLFMSEDRTRYPLSIAIAEILMHADGFIFPSLFDRKAYNLVLTTAAADQKIAAVKYWRGTLHGHEQINGQPGIQSTLHDHALEIDGDLIRWTGQFPEQAPQAESGQVLHRITPGA